MLKKLSFIIAILIATPILMVGCGETLQPDNSVTLDVNYDFNIDASCNDNQIVLQISNVAKPNKYKQGDQLQVVMLKPYEYYQGETDLGVNCIEKNYDNGTNVGIYTVGQSKKIQIDRFADVEGSESSYDNLYNKFILAKDGKLVAGPFFVGGKIESERNYEQKVVAATKKGILNEGRDRVIETGCGWTELNVNLNYIILPNEKFENGQVVPIDTSIYTEENSIRFESNGKTYFMDKNAVKGIDDSVKFFSKRNVKVVMILLNDMNFDQNSSPYFMSYPAARDYSKSKLWAFDTSTEIGAGYFTAVMEFIGDRYSREDGEYGYSHRFVVGNEIDLSGEWNPVANYDVSEQLPLDEYVEEYARTLRIADQATKKYYADSMVLVPTCHFWAGSSIVLATYSPKTLFDYLNAKVSYQGNFNWGMAGHPYPEDLPNPNFLEKETESGSINGNINTSSCITWSNLEILDLYLAQPELKYNGQIRRLYLTEGGISSAAYGYKETINEPLQAAGLAYAYYKAVSLDCLDAFIYFRMVDASGDGPGSNFGIYKQDNATQKPAYEVFKYIDTQYSFDVANLYLDRLKFRYNGKVYSVAKGTIHSYRDIIKIFDSDFNLDSHWSEDKIKVRTALDVPKVLS